MNEIVKELLPLLQKVADKLDSSAAYLWQLQLQQVYVLITSGLIKYALWFVFVVIGFIALKRFYHDGLMLLEEIKLAQKEDAEISEQKKQEREEENKQRAIKEREYANNFPTYSLLMNGYRSTYSHYETERLRDAKQAKEEQEKFIGMAVCAWLTVSILTYIIFLPSITELITMIANPQYYALHEIIKMVK